MRRILVLRGGALGDFIVTLPALALLRQRWPDSRIELAGNAKAAVLGCAEGVIDRVHSQHEARWSALYGSDALPPDFGEWLAEFDLVISYWPDPEGELTARFPLRSGQVFQSGAALPTRAPASAHYCEALRPLGLGTKSYFYRLRADGRAADGANVSRDPIAIHAGSGSPRKNWPIARWRKLSEWLRSEFGAELLIVIGEAESETGATETLVGDGPVARDLPLLELAARLAGCRLFLGHDSGVSHLAAACGVPCVLLFGPSDPGMWSPPAPHVCVVRNGVAMESISISDVQAAVEAALGAGR